LVSINEDKIFYVCTKYCNCPHYSLLVYDKK
jgi:hypothetical protein